MGTSHIVVDGSNIATEGRSLPSLQQLLDAVAAVAEDQKPDTVTVIVDATFGHRIDAEERDAYDAKVSNGEIITPPAGVIGRGDAFILEVADRADAVVLSNDSFQEFHGDYRWLFDEGRLLGGKHVPGVGWIFLDRSPVRGPASRKATSAAKRKRKEADKKSSSPSSKGSDDKSKSKSRPPKGSKKQSAKPSKSTARSSSKSSGNEPEPYNELMPFLDFVGAHEVGSVVTGEIEQFSSHGAYVMVGETRCYIPLKAMGDPPPRSARDVMSQGETKAFRVEAIDTPRRGIDLSLAEPASSAPVEVDEAAAADRANPRTVEESASVEAPASVEEPAAEPVTEADLEDPNLSVSQRRKLRAALAAQQAAAEAESSESTTDATPGETPATERAGAKKAAVKKAAAKKSTAKKATAKKAGAKKATTKKAAAKKTTAKKATTKKAASKKAAATKKVSPAKKSTAKKATTKKAATAKVGTAKKAAATKTAAKKSAAKKASSAKKAAAKKRATTKKAAAKKSPETD